MNEPVDEKQIELKFRNDLQKKQKTHMLMRFFRMDDDLIKLEVPLFTEFSGQKKILPFRNTKCLSHKCLYDIDELVSKYKKSAYSNFLNFICHTCRKMVDINDFYLDSELARIIEKLWDKYNVNDRIICPKVIIYKSGEWEPVLPGYVRKLEQLLEQDRLKTKLKKREQISDFQDDEDEVQALQQMEVYESLPMIDEFDPEDYKKVLQEFQNEDNPRSDNEVILRRYHQQLKWGEWMHIRNQSAFLPSCMAIYANYLIDYFKRRTFNKKQIAIYVIKVTSFDRVRLKPEYYFITENLDTFTDPVSEVCGNAIFIIFFDERWILAILDIKSCQLKTIDFLDDGLSRYKQDEIFEMCSRFVQVLCPPLIVNRLFGNSDKERDLQNAQIISEQLKEIRKKLQYYTDCGHHIAQYLYNWIKSEILMESSPEVITLLPVGEGGAFTSRLCWVLLKMTEEKPISVPYYTYKPKLKIEDQPPPSKQDSRIEDSLDKLRKDREINPQTKSAQVLKQWDFQRTTTKNQNNLSSTVGNILQNLESNTRPVFRVDKERERANKYWPITSQQPREQPQENLEKQIIRARLQSQKTILPLSRGQWNPSSQVQSRNIPQHEEAKEKPFLILPRWQLQEKLEKFKEEIIKEHQEKKLARNYYYESTGQYDKVDPKYQTSQSQSKYGDSSLNSRYSEFTSENQRQSKRYQGEDRDSYNMVQDRQLMELQKQLGLSDKELKNMDILEYNKMLDLMDITKSKNQSRIDQSISGYQSVEDVQE